ncbi:hypothetical protein SALBM135S_08473 [Streptomyces alboniger]
MPCSCPSERQLPPTGDDDLAGVVRSLACAAPGGEPGPREHAAADAPTPVRATGGLSHCLVSAELAEADIGPALARLRRDNPRAFAAALGGRLVMFSAAPPVCDTLHTVYAVAPSRNGDTTQAYRAALQTLAIARSYRLDNLEAGEVLPLLSVLSQEAPEREAFLAHCLGPLRNELRHAHLLATLTAYLRHGMCTAAAARSLFVHRHTLEYRLDRVRHLTGLDLSHPLHRLRAELALLMTGDASWHAPRHTGRTAAVAPGT